MKNFRKSIIALATAAAMLIPSVAMAATLTTTVDKDIDGDVYVGFYDGAVLKDVVKTTVAEATITDAAAAEATELPMTVTVSTEEVGVSESSGKTCYKLVFTAKGESGAKMNAINMTMSFDDTVVELVSADEYLDDIASDEIMAWEKGEGKDYSMVPFTLLTHGSGRNEVKFSKSDTKSKVVGDRVVANFAQYVAGKTVPLDSDLVIFELYYRLEDGKSVGADTFKIETEIGEGTLHEALQADPGKENGIKLANPDGGFTYGCWLNGVATPDTIKLVTPWDAPVIPEVTTKTLSVDVPAGAESYKATMFIWDADQIAQCAPIALN